MQNWKTTLGGVLSAIGLGTFASMAATREGQISLALAALGALLKGWAGKDASPGLPFAKRAPENP